MEQQQYPREFSHLNCDFLSELAHMSAQFFELFEKIRRERRPTPADLDSLEADALKLNTTYTVDVFQLMAHNPLYAKFRFNTDRDIIDHLTVSHHRGTAHLEYDIPYA